MSPKELFQTDKELTGWWASIAHSDRIQKVLLHVRSELMDLEMTPEATRGARMFEHVLTTLSDGEDKLPHFPSPGLNHDLESDLRPEPPPMKAPRPPRTKTKK